MLTAILGLTSVPYRCEADREKKVLRARCILLTYIFTNRADSLSVQLFHTSARDLPSQPACCCEAGKITYIHLLFHNGGAWFYHTSPYKYNGEAMTPSQHQQLTMICVTVCPSPEGDVLLQLWLVALIGMMARASPPARLAIALGVAALSALALPSNLWRPQLKRLGLLAAFIFVATAIGAGALPICSSQTANEWDEEVCSHHSSPFLDLLLGILASRTP